MYENKMEAWLVETGRGRHEDSDWGCGRDGGWWQSRMKEGEENLQWERDRRSQWLFCHWWGSGFARRLCYRLLVEEKGVCGVFRGWTHGGERRKQGKCWLGTGKLLVFGWLRTRFSPCPGHEMHPYL